MIDWTALKKDGKIVEHSTIQKVTFPFLGRPLAGSIVGYESNNRVWIQLDGSTAQHLVNKSELTYIAENQEGI